MIPLHNLALSEYIVNLFSLDLEVCRVSLLLTTEVVKMRECCQLLQ